MRIITIKLKIALRVPNISAMVTQLNTQNLQALDDTKSFCSFKFLTWKGETGGWGGGGGEDIKC